MRRALLLLITLKSQLATQFIMYYVNLLCQFIMSNNHAAGLSEFSSDAECSQTLGMVLFNMNIAKRSLPGVVQDIHCETLDYRCCSI